MTEYISREAAVSVIHKWLDDIFGIDEVECTVLNKRLNAIPAADVVPVRHGRWIWTETGNTDYGQFWICSECKDRMYYQTRYCPNCGARMDGDGE